MEIVEKHCLVVIIYINITLFANTPKNLHNYTHLFPLPFYTPLYEYITAKFTVQLTCLLRWLDSTQRPVKLAESFTNIVILQLCPLNWSNSFETPNDYVKFAVSQYILPFFAIHCYLSLHIVLFPDTNVLTLNNVLQLIRQS